MVYEVIKNDKRNVQGERDTPSYYIRRTYEDSFYDEDNNGKGDRFENTNELDNKCENNSRQVQVI